MIKCPKCGKEPAIKDPNYGILPCETCQLKDEQNELNKAPEFTTISKSNRIVGQRDTHGVDLIQPFMDGKGTPNHDFIQNYPDKLDDYYTEESLKKL